MDTVYRVVLALETSGSLGTKLGDINAKFEAAHGSATRFQHGLVMAGEMGSRALEHVGSFLEGIADKITHVAEIGATMGIGAIFGTAAYGVTHLNRELEETQISLGAIFQAQGFAQNFNEAFKMGGEQIAKMKQDVKTLPGDLGQLSAIMSSIATPAAMGGMGADQIRQLAGQSMLVGRIVLGAQADNAMIAREMANLLSGRAGAHNIMGLRLGLAGEKAKEFNAMSAQERVADIEKIFDKYKGANDRFGQSFIANWTTLKDNIKYGFLADATSPLFDAVKRTMASINTWFDSNQEKVKSWASAFGTRLAAGWESATAGAERLVPVLENMGRRFFEVWDAAVTKAHELEPILMRVAGVLEHLTIKDIGRGVKDVAELKLAGMGLQAAGGALHTGLQGLMMARMMGFAGGGMAGGGAAGGAAAGAAEAVGGFSALSMALPVAIVGAAGLAGAIDDLTDKTNKYHTEATALATEIKENATSVWHDLGIAVQPALEKLRDFGDFLGLGLLQDIDAVSNAARSLGQFFRGLPAQFESYEDTVARNRFRLSVDTPGAIKEHEMDTLSAHVANLALIMDPQKQEKKKQLPGGGGGTNIGKVEIVVRGSNDPSRVARLVKSELEKIARNPTRSPGVPNWAEARR